jgi:AraC-like DNA-binding protein
VDGYAALIDLLVESDGDGASIAARAHISRFHFDRLVGAVLRETPGAFRRRLLLERGAWLLGRGAPVLDAAAAAGYASPESFARAFRRAYGSAPSAFAGDYRLDAPNGIHFHPPGGLVVPGASEGATMDLTDRLLAHDLDTTRRLLDVADGHEDEPLADSSETVGSMLERLVWTKEMWLAAVGGRPLPERRPDAVRERLDASGPAFVELVRSIRERGAWETAFVDATCDPPESFTYGGMVAHVITWSAHRRQLVVAALARAGVAIDTADPLAWERA